MKKMPSKRGSRVRAARWYWSAVSRISDPDGCDMPALYTPRPPPTRRIRTSNRRLPAGFEPGTGARRRWWTLGEGRGSRHDQLAHRRQPGQPAGGFGGRLDDGAALGGEALAGAEAEAREDAGGGGPLGL